MIEFGKTLRDAREAKGMTIAQIAEATHMSPTTIEDLEKEDFSRIPAPIYGRGFVKLYCETVGIDAKPLVAEFMEIYNGSRDTVIKERPVAPRRPTAPQPVAAPAPPPEQEPIIMERPPAPVQENPEPPAVEAPEPPPHEPFPKSLQEPVAAPEPPQASAPDLFSSQDDLWAAAEQALAQKPAGHPSDEQPEPRLSRYAAPVSQTRAAPVDPLSPAIWRISLLAGAAIVALWLAFLGVRALYRATSATPSADGPQQTEVEKPQPAQTQKKSAAAQPAAAQPAASRKPQEIPALYVD